MKILAIVILALCMVNTLLWRESVRQREQIGLLTEIAILQVDVNKNNITAKEDLIKVLNKAKRR